MLVGCFFKFSEMTYQLMEIYFMLYAEPVPQIAAYHDTSEAHILGLLDSLKTHASQGIDVLVDKPLVVGFAYLLRSQRGLHFVVQRVKQRMQQDVIALFLEILQVTYSVSAARDVFLKPIWHRFVRIINMDALQVVLLLKIVILMYHNLSIHLGRNQRQQTFHIQRLRLRLIDMEYIHTFLKQSRQYLIFLYKICR